MTVFVVDTNVAIAANGRGTHADKSCRLTCVRKLGSLVARETVAIDDGNLILDEYRKHLNFSGSPGVGDVFFKHVFDHQYQDSRVRRIRVTPAEDDRRGFEELPENTFDRSDRKFLAVAVGAIEVAADAVVLNATDSDWGEQQALMDGLGVEVNELCPQHVRGEPTRTMDGGSGSGLPWDAKYPGTPYWPWSPSIGRGDDVHANPDRFVGADVVATEKLDGGNTLLHAGRVFARSVSAPSEAKWMAMVKKHHAWKVNESDVWLYGEDVYGVHSIEYGPVAERETFHAFALRGRDGAFAAFAEVEEYAKQREIPVVPVLFRGRFRSVAGIRAFMEQAHAEPSALGGEREGVVLRLAQGFPAAGFRNNVCKSVRAGHVQTDEHWTRKWRPCRIAREAGPPHPPASPHTSSKG